MLPVKTIKCTRVVAQVSLGFYDAERNLLREELFPQSEDRLGAATLFHPHLEQLGKLVETCREQARTEVAAEVAAGAIPGQDGADAGVPGEPPSAGEARRPDEPARSPRRVPSRTVDGMPNARYTPIWLCAHGPISLYTPPRLA
jgi:hypothetical protein